MHRADFLHIFAILTELPPTSSKKGEPGWWKSIVTSTERDKLPLNIINPYSNTYVMCYITCCTHECVPFDEAIEPR